MPAATATRRAHAPLDPFRGRCPLCTAEIIIAELRGRLIALEREILEEFPCPQCEQIAGMGQTRTHHCLRCGGSHRVGEPLPTRGAIVLDAYGRARVYRGERGEYEAVHRRHACAD